MSSPTRSLCRSLLVLALLGATVAAFSFTLILNRAQPPPNGTGLPVKWPAGDIPLRIMLGDATNLSDGSSFNQSAHTAAQTWNAVLGSARFTTTFATGTHVSGNRVNEIVFGSEFFGRDIDDRALAVTASAQSGNRRIETDIVFNTDFTWDSYRGNIQLSGTRPIADLQRVVLHELGHVLGIAHPEGATPNDSPPLPIMFPAMGNHYELNSDDTAAAQALYGPPGVPANDNFASAPALLLTANGTLSVKGYNTNATPESGEPGHLSTGDVPSPNPKAHSVWWRWTAPSSAAITIDTQGSYFDTLLAVYTGSSLAGLTRIAASNDIEAGVVQTSRVTFTAVAGTVYHIAVDGFSSDTSIGSDSGGLTLNLDFEGDLGTAPAITTQPASATVTSGGSASFSVVATGTAPLSYQWSLGGIAISGATSATYSIASATSSSAGTYSVTVSNAAGSVTSSNATLTVNTPAPTPAPSGGGGGGGGAPSLWFVNALAALALARACTRRPTSKM